MKKFIGEYNASLKKLYGSLRKRFGLDYDETLEEVDTVLQDKEYAVVFVSSDATFSQDLITEVNKGQEYQAFGFYREGTLAYKSVQEVREMAPKLLGDDSNRFVFIEVEIRSRFRLELPKTIFIKQGYEAGRLWIDVIKTRPVIENEVIRKLNKNDLKEFNELLNKLYVKRWENRKDIFDKGYKLTPTGLLNLCNVHNSKNAVVCVKDEKIVGFIIYEYVCDRDNRAYSNTTVLTIKDIYVDELYRRQGIATKMFEGVIKILAKFKSKKLKFKVWTQDEETMNFVSSLHPRSLYTVYEIDV